MRNMHKFIKLLLAYLVICNNLENVHSVEHGYATSVARTVELLEKEENLLIGISNYIGELQEKFDDIISIVDELLQRHNEIGNNAEKYFSNPLHSFSLIRRLHSDWPKWIDYITKPMASDILKMAQTDLPTSTDIKEAVEGLQRIQEFYHMNPIYLAEGIYENESESELSCLDLYTISNELLRINMTSDAVLWFKVTMEKCAQLDETEIYIYEEIHAFHTWHLYLDYAKALIEQNNIQEALDIIKVGTQKFPFNKQIWFFKLEIVRMLNSTNNSSIKPILEEPDLDFINSCRFNTIISHKNLHCNLERRNGSFYTLAPLKMEVLKLNPFVALYHDVISDWEIEYLKSQSWTDLYPAMVYSNESGGGFVSNHRVAQNTWLMDNYTEILFERVADITGLNTDGFETLSVINYGIGGYYQAHEDYFNDYFEDSVNDDRIATVLMYLSDVEAGGGTSFPYLNLQVLPEKGSILFWYNLQNNGDVDELTTHGACPVILGSKWVGTIWIRSNAQFLRKPCYKEKSEYV